ncbi:glycoside hydrolase family 38 N-terminal domain-containing protein [Aeromonas media]|uniref:glycoside hydrolase family 38 N-terminal domain-containing protein n=1 Tax=Aeromonas media TaxID=651 RepID=UPI0038D050FB
MKKLGHVVYQTHWDNEWYFTDRESQVQLVYHMRETIKMLEEGAVDHFLLDGQTAIVEDYLALCPEDRGRIEALIKAERLFIGPWHTQTETFAVSGEAMINNLRLGIEYANALGGSSMVSYLPDSFGHPVDFPQIFNGVGITKFSFRRGMGDKHGLPTEFFWDGPGGSRVITNVLIDGYGWSYDPFFNGTLLSKDLASECKTNSLTPLELVASKSPFDEFLLTMGNDQTPIREDFKEKLAAYNAESDEYHFVETTFDRYFDRLQVECGERLPSYFGEFLDTQYSRVHKSINSVRYDVKQLQDKIERLMTYNLQPLMAMADKLGLPWEQGLVDEIWRLLARAQTHSVCTNTDRTNARIFERLKMAHELAESTHVYLLRKLALSCELTAGRSPLILVNPLPEADRVIARYRVFTANADFSLWIDEAPVAYGVVAQSRDYGGIWRKDESLHDERKYYYLTEIEVMIDLPAFGYKVLEVMDGGEPAGRSLALASPTAVIVNEYYRLWVAEGEIHLFDRRLGKEFTNVLSFENDGDAGDNYDHCPPERDWCLDLDLAGAEVTVTELPHSATLRLEGRWWVPSDLAHRAKQEADRALPFSLVLTLKEGSDVIGLQISVDNQSLNHRLRMLVNSQIASRFSRAGTQFFEVERDTQPAELADWREKGFVEEPTTTEPLLNYVSLIGEGYYTSVFTQGCKEYQVVGEAFDRLAITLFRACGHFGLPDLSRRPGRASGLAEKIIPTPDSQLQKSLSFELALHLGQHYEANRVRQRYVKFAAINPYYHEQSLSRTGEFNISYFHTNPLGFKVSNRFSLGELRGSEAVFSTLLKRPDGGYLLRLCNCEGRAIQPGAFCSEEGGGMKAMANLLGHELAEARPDKLSAGQLVSYILG